MEREKKKGGAVVQKCSKPDSDPAADSKNQAPNFYAAELLSPRRLRTGFLFLPSLRRRVLRLSEHRSSPSLKWF
ncbi:hypothetical protein ACOSQ2_014778 [Xanthoceras sorbifolium]